MNPNYTPQLWHATLLLYGTLAVSVFATTVIGTTLPALESILLVAYILGFFGVLVPLVYLGPHGTAKDVFATFLNNGGWSSQGLSFFVGITGNAFAFLGILNPYCLLYVANLVCQVPTLSTTYAGSLDSFSTYMMLTYC